MTTPAPAEAPRELRDVRTAADAAVWLDQRATEYLTEAGHQRWPDHARGLRLAGSTLQAVAEVSRWWRDDVAAAEGLTCLARSYPGMAITGLPRQMRYYELACEFIAVPLGRVAAQLTHATGPQRAHRAAVVASERPAGRGRNL
jgi:hypothetical protein